MSISYEEALETLTSMFGAPWTQETLDTVLRHFKGHMENTVEAVLAHGDKDPQALITQLQSGVNPEEAKTSMDEELARQLEREERRRSSRQVAGSRSSQQTTTRRPDPPPAAPPKPKGRGTPTELPPDFLRIPGAAPTNTSASMDQDEALARMLQDELFAQELRNNPEFAHLARGRSRGAPASVNAASRRSGRIGEMPTRNRPSTHSEGPNIMDRISEMGDNAKKRLAVLAAQWNERENRSSAAGQSMGASPTGAAERRGLLDDVDDDGEEMEMTFSRNDSRKDD